MKVENILQSAKKTTEILIKSLENILIKCSAVDVLKKYNWKRQTSISEIKKSFKRKNSHFD